MTLIIYWWVFSKKKKEKEKVTGEGGVYSGVESNSINKFL